MQMLGVEISLKKTSESRDHRALKIGNITHIEMITQNNQMTFIQEM